MSTIAYYITAHGFGHGVRSCDILRAVHQRCPATRVIIVTDLPKAFLENRLPGIPCEIRRGVFDTGLVQRDSVRADVEASLSCALELLGRRDELLRRECDFIRERDVGLVVADIPAIPLEAAAREGIPGVAVGNFSWNWIYAEFVARDPRWQEVVASFEQGYACADLLLRLPFAEEMTAFPRHMDLPVVAEPGTARRDELAALTGAPPDRRWVLLSFSTLDWDAAALDRVAQLDDYVFFTVLPLAWDRPTIFSVDPGKMAYADILASVDAVVTKPGFGVLSECVVNRKPMVYVERTDFREYAVLEKAVQRYLRHQHIPAQRLYLGDLGDALDTLWLQPEPRDVPPVGGGRLAAEQLLARIGT